MNKKTLLSIAAFAFALSACSDYSADANDFAVGTSNPDPSAQISTEMFYQPDDFDLAKYLELNPDIKANQIIRALKDENKSFIDSMSNTADSIAAEDGSMMTVGAYMQKRYALDTAEFIHGNAEFTHKVFLLAGYGEDLWKGVDEIDKEQRSMLVRFNKIQHGKASIKEDMDYVNNFKYDESLLERHYVMFGILEGRPYKYCASSEIGTEKSLIVPDTLGVRPRIMDYAKNRFCKNKEDGLVYSIK